MNVVYATVTFPHVSPDGARGVVPKGSHWPADDPIVQTHPEAFSTDPRYGLLYSQEPAGWNDPPVEQATAAPGERRMTRPMVDEAFDEADGLRAELTRLGVKVDGRWSLGRLREEMSKVGQ